MKNLSKSRYTLFRQCPKALWMTIFKPNEAKDDPALNYHNLSDLCQNGGEAMTLFPSIAKMSPAEAAAAREALLRYCELDTLAMVKVWEKLKELL